MAWLETIRLLAARSRIDGLLRELPHLLARDPGVGTARQVRIYRQPMVGSDLLVCLWREGTDEPGQSREGLLLAEYLSDYGLVDHAVWEEVGAMPPGPGTVT
jgi:hypothetical protein